VESLPPLEGSKRSTPFESEIALVDQVQQREAEAVVVLGDLHHQAEVGPDHVLAGHRVPLLDPCGKGILLGHGQERNLHRLPHVQVQRALGFIEVADRLRRRGHDGDAVDHQDARLEREGGQRSFCRSGVGPLGTGFRRAGVGCPGRFECLRQLDPLIGERATCFFNPSGASACGGLRCAFRGLREDGRLGLGGLLDFHRRDRWRFGCRTQ